MMNLSAHFTKERFIDDRLILKNHQEVLRKKLPQFDDPVFAAVVRGWVKAHGFYRKLAEVFELSFIDSIPTPLESEASLSVRVPLELLVKARIYVYRDKHGPVCAASSPYINESLWSEIRCYLPDETARLVIAVPSEVHRAVQHAFHHQAAIVATDRVAALYPEHSSKLFRNKIFPHVFPNGMTVVFIICLLLFPFPTLLFVFGGLNLIYFILNPYKVYIFFRSLNPTKLFSISDAEVKDLTDEELPVYTILIPLKQEVEVVPQIVKNIFALDYPPEKLDIKFVTEITDTATQAALHKAGIDISSAEGSIYGAVSELVLVPISSVSTKPRSCNFAAAFARGLFTVIYDAEDRPDPDQLKKSVIAFRKAKLDTVCMQAHLNFFNAERNILSRLFSLEYSFWFDFYLPGSQEVGSAITLGGTSNHFITDRLRQLGFWDPYNVTEDADLGLRLYRHRWQTAVINSYTLEEANSVFMNWLKQRTRWQKGFLVTFLVHAGHPREAVAKLGITKFLRSLFSVSSNFFLPLLNPLLWIMFAASFLPFDTLFKIEIPWRLMRYTGLFNLAMGNLMHMLVYGIVAYKKRQLKLLPLIPLMPIYWLGISLATWRALWQFMWDPYRWEKTKHGLR